MTGSQQSRAQTERVTEVFAARPSRGSLTQQLTAVSRTPDTEDRQSHDSAHRATWTITASPPVGDRLPLPKAPGYPMKAAQGRGKRFSEKTEVPCRGSALSGDSCSGPAGEVSSRRLALGAPSDTALTQQAFVGESVDTFRVILECAAKCPPGWHCLALHVGRVGCPALRVSLVCRTTHGARPRQPTDRRQTWAPGCSAHVESSLLSQRFSKFQEILL